MHVPQDIRAIPRPKNTYVKAYGKKSVSYEVVSRKGCVYTDADGKEITVDRDGLVIGMIIDSKFVPKGEKEEKVGKLILKGPDSKSWAMEQLCLNVGQDLLAQLRTEFGNKLADTIFTVAILRVCDPEASIEGLCTQYRASMLSEMFANVDITEDSVEELFVSIGKLSNKIEEFFQKRRRLFAPSQAKENNPEFLISGNFVSPKTNLFSWYLSFFENYSRTKSTSGDNVYKYGGYSILLAASLARYELVCMGLYPQQTAGSKALDDFVRSMNLENSLVFTGNEFIVYDLNNSLKNNKGLHYLNKIGESEEIVEESDLLSPNKGQNVDTNTDSDTNTYSESLINKVKCQTKDARVKGRDRFLYALNHSNITALEKKVRQSGADTDILLDTTKKDGLYSDDTALDLLRGDAAYAYDSDLNLNLWQLGIYCNIGRTLESMVEFYDSNMPNEFIFEDPSYRRGWEFCNFVVMAFGFKIVCLMDAKDLRQYDNYITLLSALNNTTKKLNRIGQWVLQPCSEREAKLLDALDLISLEERKKLFPAKVGRPKLYKDDEDNKKTEDGIDSDSVEKRKPGRPKGSKNKSTLNAPKETENLPKRKPGRPKGAKNKPKPLDEDGNPIPPQPKIHRKPGRPLGSKNKPKPDNG